MQQTPYGSVIKDCFFLLYEPSINSENYLIK